MPPKTTGSTAKITTRSASPTRRRTRISANPTGRRTRISASRARRRNSRSASPERHPRSLRDGPVKRRVKARRLRRAAGAGRPPRNVAERVPGGARVIRADPPLDPRARGAAAAFPPAGVVVAAGAGAGADEGDRPGRNRRTDMKFLKHAIPLAMLGLAILFAQACKKPSAQAKFATPEEAAASLLQAFKTQDMEKMEAIFGREGIEAVASGDPVSDRNDREVIALAMEQSWRWAPHGADGKELIIGDEQWPFPVPLVKA